MRKTGPRHAGRRRTPNLGLATFFAVASVVLLAATIVLAVSLPAS